MTTDQFTQFESLIEDVQQSLNAIGEYMNRLSLKPGTRNSIVCELSDIWQSADGIYALAEDIYAASDDRPDLSELQTQIPNTDKMSVNEYDSLWDAIANWRESIGLPRYNHN